MHDHEVGGAKLRRRSRSEPAGNHGNIPVVAALCMKPSTRPRAVHGAAQATCDRQHTSAEYRYHSCFCWAALAG